MAGLTSFAVPLLASTVALFASPFQTANREQSMNICRCIWLALLATIVGIAAAGTPVAAQQQQQRPNIVVIWGDDIGQSNISAYSHGMMGYQTPNIDRIAKEGVMFTDYYAEQSCTAGRASFITGQSGLRTGMTKVGFLEAGRAFFWGHDQRSRSRPLSGGSSTTSLSV